MDRPSSSSLDEIEDGKMVRLIAALAVIGCGVLVRTGAIQEEREDEAGELHVVSLDKIPRRLDVHVNDIIQIEYDFAIVPSEDITYLDVDLRTSAQEDPVSEMGVVFIPLRSSDGDMVVGAGRIAAFMRADAAGEADLIVRPRQSPRGPFKIHLRVRPIKVNDN
jgi:hypothetical protein